MEKNIHIKIKVTEAKRKALKMKTVKTGTTIQAVMETAIDDYLGQKSSPHLSHF